MAWYSADRFRTQGLLIGVASLAMAVLAAVLVQEAWQSTRQTLTAEAEQQCTTAVEELHTQFSERAILSDADELAPETFEAQDVSLRGLSAAVLRSYEGMEGGFLLGANRRMAGHHAGSFTLSSGADLENEARLVLDLTTRAATTPGATTGPADDSNDLLVGCAVAVPAHDAVAWALKRLSGANDPAAARRRWWLAGLVLSAVLGLAMIVSISVRLQRGIESLNAGLARLENDFDYRLAPIGGDLGVVARAVNRMADRRGALETTLRRQDRLAALGRVVAGVAHEIRNPLNSLMLTLELLDRRTRKGTPLAGGEVRQAMEEVERLDQILARLLAFGRPGFQNRRVQDVRPLIERTLRVVQDRAQRKGVHVALDLTGSTPLEADVDALAFEQILINLVTNAIDAAPAETTVRVTATISDGEFQLTVTDRGPGIQGDVREHLFTPFFTTKENGTGLGLAVSREIACHHGGSLDFEPGADGTTFVLRLPAHREQT